jgi:hypothetical protein
VKEWFPRGTPGESYEMSPALKEIEAHRGDFSVITGLCQDKARSHGDGGGDHARATASFLTGVQAKKTAGADIHLGISVDQIMADKVGTRTKLASLELSTDGQRSAGRCDSGYSCAYQFNLAWRNESVPMAPELDPRLVFERMFGLGAVGNSPEILRRRMLQKSILDSVMGEARSLQKKVNPQDNAKLDQYLTSVREIEQRIESSERLTKVAPKEFPVPSGIPDNYEHHMQAMFDLLALAFQTDTTRVATFLLAHDGSNRSFADIGVSDGHHQISHHDSDPEKLRKIALIDRFYMRQLSYFLAKMKSIKEGEGTLLDHSMIVYGGGISDGNRHDHGRLPILLAGRGNGTLKPGRHIEASKDGELPMTNLYLAMLERMGVQAERVGDSTGVLEGI